MQELVEPQEQPRLILLSVSWVSTWLHLSRRILALMRKIESFKTDMA
jgi:hypothetical protein